MAVYRWHMSHVTWRTNRERRWRTRLELWTTLNAQQSRMMVLEMYELSGGISKEKKLNPLTCPWLICLSSSTGVWASNKSCPYCWKQKEEELPHCLNLSNHDNPVLHLSQCGKVPNNNIHLLFLHFFEKKLFPLPLRPYFTTLSPANKSGIQL